MLVNEDPSRVAFSSKGETRTQPSKPIKVLIVDAQEIVRLGLRTMLETEPDFRVVGEATSRESALARIATLKPEIVVLDARLEGNRGIDTTREILEIAPGSRVLLLSNSLDEETMLAALTSGAQGYVLRDAESDTLVQAIRTIANGQSYLDPRVAHHTLACLRRMAGHVDDKAKLPLSPQEKRLLPLLAQGKTNKEIAHELGLSDKTVKNYLANVYNKLHITRRAQAAAFYSKHFA